MSGKFYHGADLVVDGARRPGLGVLVESGRIAAIRPAHDCGAAEPVVLPPDCVLAPGFVDIQANGGGGVLFNDTPTAEAALEIAEAHRRLGTTAILPTLITSEPELMPRAAEAARTAVAANAGVLGVHFEGPFISPARPGVHRPDLIRAPGPADIALLRGLAGGWDGRVILTIAPECVAIADQQLLATAGVILCAGHTAAPFEAMLPPVRGVTHVFNAMAPPTAREPGPVAAALLGDFYAGLILDLLHVHPAMVRLLFAMKSPARIMLVSDAMSVAGTASERFDLQGRRILRRNGRLETEDGVLAGADLSLAQAVRHAVTDLGLDLATAVGMASTVPASFLGLSDQVGRIAPGLRADMVLLDGALGVAGTFLGGAWQGVPEALAA